MYFSVARGRIGGRKGKLDGAAALIGRLDFDLEESEVVLCYLEGGQLSAGESHFFSYRSAARRVGSFAKRGSLDAGSAVVVDVVFVFDVASEAGIIEGGRPSSGLA